MWETSIRIKRDQKKRGSEDNENSIKTLQSDTTQILTQRRWITLTQSDPESDPWALVVESKQDLLRATNRKFYKEDG